MIFYETNFFGEINRVQFPVLMFSHFWELKVMRQTLQVGNLSNCFLVKWAISAESLGSCPNRKTS